jgi:hypothetical protein
MGRTLDFGLTHGSQVRIPKLFACCRSRDILVSDCWDREEWDVSFRRTFGAVEVQEWTNLLHKLDGCTYLTKTRRLEVGNKRDVYNKVNVPIHHFWRCC